MTDRPTRVVDAHVHLWDPARTDWYPYLARPPQGGSGDSSRMFRRFDAEIYRAEAVGWNVEKIVNVAAATGGHSIDETIELDAMADASGRPNAIIGGLPPTDTVDEAIALIDRQMAASRFRGVRPMGAFEGPLPRAEVLHALRDRGLLFELMTHPDQLRAAADAARRPRRPRTSSSSSTPDGRARTPTRNATCGGRASTRWPMSGRTCCASCRAWPCRSGP